MVIKMFVTNKMVPLFVLSTVVFFIILLVLLYVFINRQFKVSKSNLIRKPSKMDLTEIFRDIHLEPYGCFSTLDEKFFSKQVNPYSKTNVMDSGLIISESGANEDTNELIQQVINNGYDQFGYRMIHKYNSDYTKMDIHEIGVLAKLSGYNYISVYKLNEHTRGNIYLSYSPPLESQVPFHATDEDYRKSLSKPNEYTLTPKLNNYTNEIEKAPGKELSCGYICSKNGKDPLTFNDSGVEKHYMCGSTGFPDIKTPTRFAVYRIVEKN